MFNSRLVRNLILFFVILGTSIALIFYYDKQQQIKIENGEQAATLSDILSF